jgi:hypothetical protein
MGCIYAGQRRVYVALQRIVEDEGRACRHVAGKTGSASLQTRHKQKVVMERRCYMYS